MTSEAWPARTSQVGLQDREAYMRKYIVILIMSLSASLVFANSPASVFPEGTIVPQEVQAEIIEQLSQVCSSGVIPWGLAETGSRLLKQEISPEGNISHYAISFSSRYYFDGMHPIQQVLGVQVTLLLNQNGKFKLTKLSVITGDCSSESGRF